MQAANAGNTNKQERKHTMKNKAKLLVLGLGLVATALLIAQDGPPPREGGPGGEGQRGPGGPSGPGGPGGPGGMRQPPAIIAALDANHDGVIDADEIANASAALKKLDKNGDGKLTREEYLGPRPGGQGGPGGPGRPDGQRGPGGNGPGRRPGGPGGPGADNHPQPPPEQ